MSQKELPELLTLKQASELLQVHPNTLRNWDNNGTLKAVRIGGRNLRRYRKSDLDKFINKKGEKN